MRAHDNDACKEIVVNKEDICFMLNNDFLDYETHFSDGTVKNLSHCDVKHILKSLASVYSYDLECQTYLNKNHIVGDTPDRFYEAKFSNGETLKGLSGIDFEKNVILKRNTPNFNR